MARAKKTAAPKRRVPGAKPGPPSSTRAARRALQEAFGDGYRTAERDAAKSKRPQREDGPLPPEQGDGAVPPAETAVNAMHDPTAGPVAPLGAYSNASATTGRGRRSGSERAEVFRRDNVDIEWWIDQETGEKVMTIWTNEKVLRFRASPFDDLWTKMARAALAS